MNDFSTRGAKGVIRNVQFFVVVFVYDRLVESIDDSVFIPETSGRKTVGTLKVCGGLFCEAVHVDSMLTCKHEVKRKMNLLQNACGIAYA